MALTVAEVRKVLAYDRDTGVFRWRMTSSNRRRAGQAAGHCCRRSGYNLIGIGKRLYKANRLAWLYVTGEWPDSLVDHRDGNRSNDRWDNLRAATHAENLRNRGAQQNNTSGYKGVHWHPQSQKWRARIVADGKHFSLGLHETAELAHAAYCEGSLRHHGEFARAK